MLDKMGLSEKAQMDLKNLDKEIKDKLRPFYESLGVDIDTEELMWVNNEVYVIDKDGKRRELDDTQANLNAKMWNLGKDLFMND